MKLTKLMTVFVATTMLTFGASAAMAGELYGKGTIAVGSAGAGFSGGTSAYGDWSTTGIYGEQGSFVVSHTTEGKAHVHGGSGVEAGTGGYYEGSGFGYSASDLSLGGSGYGLASAGRRTNVESYRFSGDGSAVSVGTASGDITQVYGESSTYGFGSGGFEVNAPSDRWNGSNSEAGMTASANGGAFASGTDHAAASSTSSAAASSSTSN